MTAVFCTTALESAQNDHATVVQSLPDNKETHLSKLRAVFSSLGATETGAITYTMFEEKINTPEIKGYLETLGLDVWDAWSFFKLLDTDGGGAIDIEEFFMGCLRFRGQASAMDVGKILQDQNWLITSQGKFQAHVEGELNTLKESMSTLLEQMTSSRSFSSCIEEADPDGSLEGALNGQSVSFCAVTCFIKSDLRLWAEQV